MSEAPLYSGYASTWTLDLGGDIVMPGAYKGTLPAFLRRGLLCWSHDITRPVGMIRAAREDATGLQIFWQFHSHPDGEAARTIVAERNAAKLETGLSIGYRVRRSEAGPAGTRRLTELELLEVSLVGTPMNPAANVDLPKGMKMGPAVPLGYPSGRQDPATRAAFDAAVARARLLGVKV